eukprot:gb/GEZN01005114.1/.p1 GENE.gb/GEZN01005114.1/~~gb/GEZN01005114.1/.p1  ORF type:complete len:503 (+),score=51.88 gb/GEZN01005114.1/:95-1603(+)
MPGSSFSSACFFTELLLLERQDQIPLIHDFLIGDEKKLHFPVSLAASTRKILHQLGESLGVCHKSHGFGPKRSLVWSKPSKGYETRPEFLMFIQALGAPQMESVATGGADLDEKLTGRSRLSHAPQVAHEFSELLWEQHERRQMVQGEDESESDNDVETEANGSMETEANGSSFSDSASSPPPAEDNAPGSSLQAFRSNRQSSHSASHQQQRRDRRDPCRYFNRTSGCFFNQHCRWRHVCWHCESDSHSGVKCAVVPSRVELYEQAVAITAFQNSYPPAMTIGPSALPTDSGPLSNSDKAIFGSFDLEWLGSGSYVDLYRSGSGSDGSPPMTPKLGPQYYRTRRPSIGGLLFFTLPLELLMEGVLPFLSQEGPDDLLALTETCQVSRLLLSSDGIWHSRFFIKFRSFRPIRMKLRRGSSEIGVELASSSESPRGRKPNKKHVQRSKPRKHGQQGKKQKKKVVRLPELPDGGKWKARYRARFEEQLARSERRARATSEAESHD